MSSILLIGAGVFRFFIEKQNSELLERRTLLSLLSLGAIILAATTVSEIAYVLYDLLGSYDLTTFWDFVISTNHGKAASIRLLVLILLSLLISLAPDTWWSKQAFLLLGLGLISSFSAISHGASMAGSSLFVADLIHFLAAGAWAGPIFYLAYSQHWLDKANLYKPALEQISRIGLLSVMILFASGFFMSLSYMGEPEEFVYSNYGFSLFTKLGMILIILALAIYNRFVLMNRLASTGEVLDFRETIRWEAALLSLVFIATGVLTTRALPHSVTASLNPAENLLNLIQSFWR